MSAPGSRAVVTRHDIDTAQAVLDDWLEHYPYPGGDPGVRAVAYLRGLLTQALADANAAGYDEGTVYGRRLIARAVRDALEGEGL